MENFIFKQKYHFIGILGISMSALAGLVKHFGGTITGSDLSKNSLYNNTMSFAEIYIGSNPSYIDDADVIVVNSAISQNDIEYTRAKKLNKKILKREELLYLISKEFDFVIAISGTHGKSTVTSMLTEIFYNANIPFASHIGAIDKLLNSNYFISGKKYFITEACEYKNSFLSLKPHISIITNIEFDHPDCFINNDEIQNSFKTFVDNSKLIITNENLYDDKNKINGKILKGNNYNNKIISLDLNNNNIDNINIINNEKINNYFILNSPLEHNKINAGYAITLSKLLNIDIEKVKFTLKNYKGIKKRYEYIGKINDCEVIYDYAHHPTAIKNTIKCSAEKLSNTGKLYTVFEPHTYSRTKGLLKEFSECFIESDIVVILPTYPAREKEEDGVNSIELFNKITNKNKIYLESYEKTLSYLNNNLTSKDFCLILGAGNIEILANLVEKEYL